MAYSGKDQESRQIQDVLEKQKKALIKDNGKLKKTLKDKAKELIRIKGELNV